MLRLTFLALGCVVAFGASTISAQEADSQSELAPASVTLTADGELVGNAFANVNGADQPVEAKITISKDGVVVDSIYAQEDGSFAFPSVAPGVYNMYGAAANFAGGAAVTVLPSSAPATAPLTLGLSSAATAGYAGLAQATCSSCAPAPVVSSCGCSAPPVSPCGCGGGVGGGGLFNGGLLNGGGLTGGGFGGGGIGGGLTGGFGGGGIGGGLLSNPLVRIGAIGGIVAIAVDDDDDDASPDN